MSPYAQFEDVSERFFGMTKAQFAMVSAAAALFASILATVSLILFIYSASQRRHDFCVAVNTLNGAIVKVLDTSIADGQAELKDPKFSDFRQVILKGIRQDERFKSALFASRPC